MHDLILSWLRTAVPAAVGAVVAWAAASGMEVDAESVVAVSAALAAAATTVYQAVVSTAQRKWPIVGVLLGSTKVPVYRSGRANGGHGAPY